MRVVVLRVLLVSVISASIAVIIGFSQGIIQAKLTDVIQTMLSERLGHPIRIGQIQTNLIRYIKLEEINLYNQVIKSVRINYDVLAWLTRDPVITGITVDTLSVSITRRADKTLVLPDWLASLQKESNAPKFAGTLRLNNMAGVFTDYAGFQKTRPLHTPFSQAYYNGAVTLYPNRQFEASLTPVNETTDAPAAAPLQASGYFQSFTDYDIHLTAETAGTQWVNYVVNNPKYTLSQGQLRDIRMTLKPGDITGSGQFDGVSFAMPFLSQPITALSGQAHIQAGVLTLSQTQGYLAGQRVVLSQGMLSIKDKTLDLAVYSPVVAASTLAMIPQLPVRGITGQFNDFFLSITGKLTAATLSGRSWAPRLGYGQYALTDNQLSFRYANKQLRLVLDEGRLPTGLISGRLDVATQTGALDLTVTSDRLAWPGGDTALTARLTGTLDAYQVALETEAVAKKNSIFYDFFEDNLISGMLQATGNRETLRIQKLALMHQDQPVVTATGSVSTTGPSILDLAILDLPYKQQAHIQGNATVRIPDSRYYKDLSVLGTGTITGVVLPYLGTSTLAGTVSYTPDYAQLESGSITSEAGSIAVSGDYTPAAGITLRASGVSDDISRVILPDALGKRLYATGTMTSTVRLQVPAVWPIKPETLTAHGQLHLQDGQVNGVYTESLTATWGYNQAALTVSHMRIRLNHSLITGTARWDSTGLDITLDPSAVALEATQPLFNHWFDRPVSGRCSVQGRLLYQDTIRIDGSLACDQLIIDGRVLPAIRLTGGLDTYQQHYYITQSQIQTPTGSYHLQGYMNQDDYRWHITADDDLAYSESLGRTLWELYQRADLPIIRDALMPTQTLGHETILGDGPTALALFRTVSQAVQTDLSQIEPVIAGRLRAALDLAYPRQFTGTLAISDLVLPTGFSVKTLDIALENTRTHIQLNQGRWGAAAWDQVDYTLLWDAGTVGISGPCITAVIPWEAWLSQLDAPVAVFLDLDADALGILAGVPGIQSIETAGSAQLTLGGTLRSPTLDAAISLRETRLTLANTTELYWKNARLVMRNTALQLSGFPTEIALGDDAIPVYISGELAMTLPDLLDRTGFSVRTALSLDPVSGKLNLPDRIKTKVSIETASLTGQYPGKLTVSSQLAVERLTLTPRLGNTPLAIPLDLDIQLAIGNRALIKGSLLRDEQAVFIARLSHSVYLDISNNTIQITGSVADPVLTGDIYLREGDIQIANRSFQLMLDAEQQQFFGYTPDQVIPNAIYFNGSQPPRFEIRAISLIPLDNTSAMQDTRQTALIAGISGDLNDPGAAFLETYEVDRPFLASSVPLFNNRYAFSLTDAADESLTLLDILVFNPAINQDEFIQTTPDTGLEQAGEARVAAFFGQQLFRPVETILERRTGLYQINVDYTRTDPSRDQSQLGINFIEQLTDRVYARIRTDFGDPALPEPVSEYELTYYLLPNLSMNYGRSRRFDVVNTVLVPRLSIKYNYVF